MSSRGMCLTESKSLLGNAYTNSNTENKNYCKAETTGRKEFRFQTTGLFKSTFRPQNDALVEKIIQLMTQVTAKTITFSEFVLHLSCSTVHNLHLTHSIQ